ncbi:sulfotransferase family protein [Neptunicella marina]|uniref:Sulfotransferase n=1 Tax=Neptunicella marina TaxID=2125989 RepID=A0A8J6ISR9_9ALTE|nr:sulfotransferase [Neptunicella marina]MBC3764928.1 sulfotransferase [Neptunicella marina]
MRQINLHIIGVQKAGTTALASFLHQHHDIYVVDGKEAHIFDHPHFEECPDQTVFTNRQYRKRLTQFKNEKILCDATPITIFNHHFLSACYRYNPQAKFIAILRDPVERAISHYQMSKNNGQERLNMLSAFVSETQRLKKAKHGKSWNFDSSYRTQSYLQRGLYTTQLKTLFDIVPAAQILVLRQNDLRNKHQLTLNRIFDFLEVEHQSISTAKVFESTYTKSHWTDQLAKLYATFYFWIRRESPKNWERIIKSAQG